MKLQTRSADRPAVSNSGWRERLGVRVLECLAEKAAEIDSLRDILHAIVSETGVGLAGIRLREGDDYPCFAYYGFNQEFIRLENSLCVSEPATDGKANQGALVCLCGRVIEGRIDTEQPFFTRGGSFFTPSLQHLAATTEPALLGPLRGRCITEGFETHALIPLKHGAQTIGLFHLADPRPELFTADDIAFFERLGSSVSIAISQKRIVADIERRSETLRKSEQTYSKVFLACPESISIASLKDGTFLDVNDIFLQKTGYAREEVIGRTTTDLNVWFNEQERREYVDQMRKNRRVRGLEVRLRMRSGEIRSFLVSSETLEIGGEEYGINFVVDITDRKQAEDKQRKLQAHLFEAQKFQSIGTLAGGVAHDFNNLLGGIMGGLSIMDIKLGPGSELQQDIKDMMALVERGAGLTRQLLGFARLGKVEAKPVNLNDVIKKIAEMFGRTRKDLVIHAEYGSGAQTIEGDRTQLEQAILNLLVNAGQSMPDGGEIVLGTGQVDLLADDAASYGVAPGRYVKLTVADKGVGMDAETRERVFDPFFTTKAPGQGLGLGLPSVFGIVRNHGGAVTVESEPGKGATFIVYLPFVERPHAADKSPPVASRPRGKTILLVDDEAHIVRTCTLLLESLGYQVLTAQGGREAVDVFRANRERISLVILDLTMPDMNGSQAFDALRQVSSDVKVLLSSGYSVEGQASAILARGCNGFIQKPFTVATLSAKLKELL